MNRCAPGTVPGVFGLHPGVASVVSGGTLRPMNRVLAIEEDR